MTIKGGVVIQNLSNDSRRATRDLDLDLIKYPIEDNGIIEFIKMLDQVDDDISVKVTGIIEELSHQEYKGKRLTIDLTDSENNKISIKLDIGVHNNLNVEQEEYCFELDNIGENVQLLINSKEQIFAEKLKSLLKLGRFSTRYKDIFDFYYFINMTNLCDSKLTKCINEIIFKSEDMKENSYDDILKRLSSIFRNKRFLERSNTAHNNWLEIPIKEVTENVLEFFTKLSHDDNSIII